MNILKKDHRITVSLSDVDYAALSDLAKLHDVSLSWLARKAINDLLEHHEKKELQLPLDLKRPRGNFHG